MRYLVLIAIVFLVSCGTSQKETLPVNCSTEQLDEGVKFVCVDPSGKETSGIVLHGKTGQKGEQGEAGKSLSVSKQIQCSGKIEGWLEGSYYAVSYLHSEFETKDLFISAKIDTVTQSGGVVATRHASVFALSSMPHPDLAAGIFTLSHKGDVLEVKRHEQIEVVSLPCSEVKL